MTIDFAPTFYFHREGPGVLLGMSRPGRGPGFQLDVDDAWLPDAHGRHRAPRARRCSTSASAAAGPASTR